MLGLSTRADKKSQFVPFQHPYILVEDVSGGYKPILAREFPDNSYPRIYQHHSSKTVFAQNSEEEAEQGSQNVEAVVVHNSVASGIRISCTTAPVERNVLHNATLKKLTARSQILDTTSVKNKDTAIVDKLSSVIKRKRVSQPEPRKRRKFKKRPNVYGLAFYTRPGYCENCNVKYEEFHTVKFYSS